jgi:hypothetical protein
MRTPIPHEVVEANQRIASIAFPLFHPGATEPWERLGFIRREEPRSVTVGSSTQRVLAALGGDHAYSLRLVFDLERFAAHRPDSSSPVHPLPAAWLYEARQHFEPVETAAGVLTPAAWCVACGKPCEDLRGRLGYVGRIRRFCDECQRGKLRSQPVWRACAASDCMEWFLAARMNQIYHSDACTEAARRGR